MRRFLQALGKRWAARSRPSGRPALRLEALDERLLPSTLTLPPGSYLPTAPVLTTATPVSRIVYPNSSDRVYFLNVPLDLVGSDGVTYGRVSFSRLTANSDGSSTLEGGTFTSGTQMQRWQVPSRRCRNFELSGSHEF